MTDFNPKSQKKELFDFFHKRLQAKFIYEALDFERGLDPKEAMGIGKKAQLKKLDQETYWGFKFGFKHSEIWDIVKYNDYLIKITKLTNSNGISYYAALNNTGEPYNNTPSMYDTPEEALDWEQKYIDQYNMGL